MATQIYVNLPVKNLDKSVKFFTALGFKFNPQFTDEKASCMIVGDDIYVMLLVESFFKTFLELLAFLVGRHLSESGEATLRHTS